MTLNGGRVSRRHAGTLWSYRNDGRAAGNLRSALWRSAGPALTCCMPQRAPSISILNALVDVTQQSVNGRQRVINGSADGSDFGSA